MKIVDTRFDVTAGDAVSVIAYDTSEHCANARYVIVVADRLRLDVTPEWLAQLHAAIGTALATPCRPRTPAEIDAGLSRADLHLEVA